MVVRMLTAFAIDILASVGSTKATTWLNAGWAVALLPALWIGTHLDGIRGAAIAHSIVAVAVALPLSVLAVRLAGVSLLPALPKLIRPLIAAIVSAAVILLVQRIVGNSAVVQLVVAGFAGLLAYVLLVTTRDQARQLRTRVTRVRSTTGG